MQKFLKSAPEPADIKLSIDPNSTDESQRLVIGFATLDNIDQTGDIVTAAASIKAFSNFRGNIRLMHEPEPVGKVVDFQPAVYIDEQTGEQYNGIQVTAKISKAAEKTWIMCQDGTISGFSIGGRVTKTSVQYDERTGANINVIDEYVLTELSLVDNPANQFANITALRKSVDNVIHEGDEFNIAGDLNKVLEFTMEGGHPKVAQEQEKETVIDNEMVEKNNDAENTDAGIATVEAQDMTTAEGAAEELATDIEVEQNDEEDSDDKDADSGDEKEEAEDDSYEESVETVDLKAEIDRAIQSITDMLEQASKETEEKMQKLRNEVIGEIEQRVQKVNERQDSLDEKIETEKSLSKKLDDLSKDFSEFSNRLDNVSKSAAFKKSVDNEPQTSGKASTWKGAFTGDYRQA